MFLDPTPPYDREAALGRLGGDEGLFRDLVRFFIEDYPPLVQVLRRGLDAGDFRLVDRAAHSLKGLAGGCGSGPAAEGAGRIEWLIEGGRHGELPRAVDLLVAELDRMRDALAAELDG